MLCFQFTKLDSDNGHGQEKEELTTMHELPLIRSVETTEQLYYFIEKKIIFWVICFYSVLLCLHCNDSHKAPYQNKQGQTRS